MTVTATATLEDGRTLSVVGETLAECIGELADLAGKARIVRMSGGRRR